MYLGDSTMGDAKTYFLPLLPLWKKKAAEGDEELAGKVRSLEKLAVIDIISNDNLRGLPGDARALFSHGGYKIVLRLSDDGTPLLAVRDIDSGKQDESGRNIPFLLVVAGSKDEVPALRRMAVYIASHLDTFSKTIAGLFEYDSDKNGISFNLPEASKYFAKISKAADESLLTLKGAVRVAANADVPLLVLPDGIDQALAAAEQNLANKKITFVKISDILPFDNIKRLTAMVKSLVTRKQNIFAERRVLYAIGSAAVVGFILGYLLAR